MIRLGDMGKYGLLVGAVMLWLMGLPMGVPAAEKRVTVTGVGFIAGGDTAAARDQALRDAKVRAVEQAVGVAVDSRTALHKSLLIDDTVLTRSRGTVRSFRILKEGVIPLGLYQVEIAAVVDASVLTDALARIAGEEKILMVHRLYKESAVDGQRRLVDRLAADFEAADFKVEKRTMETHLLTQLDGVKVAKLARAAGCDLVLTSRLDLLDQSCPVKNMCVVRANGSAVLFDGKSGRRFAKAEISNVRGFGSTTVAATNDAFSKTADGVADQLISELLTPSGMVARIEVLRLADDAAYQSFKRTLATLRWVTRVEEDTVGFHPNRSVFLVSFAQEADYLSGMLKKIQGYAITRRSGGTFVLEPTTAGR